MVRSRPLPRQNKLQQHARAGTLLSPRLQQVESAADTTPEPLATALIASTGPHRYEGDSFGAVLLRQVCWKPVNANDTACLTSLQNAILKCPRRLPLRNLIAC